MTADTPSEANKKIAALEERVALLERLAGSQVPAAVPSTPAPAPQSPPSGVGVNQPAAKPKTSTEIEFGQKWLTVVGVVLIFLAALFFVQFVFRFVGPAGKVALSYTGAAILFAISVAARHKYGQFAAIVSAGAWGVTYLVTYAMHFIPATRIITSASLEMFLLAAVVAVLLLLALVQKSRLLIAIGLVLGYLTLIISPLSLFAIFGTCLLLAALAAVAILMPWGDLVLPAALGAYMSYLVWYGRFVGRAALQGGGEKELVGLIALTVIWLAIAVGLVLRRDRGRAFGGAADVITLALSGGATALLGLGALQALPLLVVQPRTAAGTWLLFITGLTAGWAVIAHEYRRRAALTAASAVIVTLLVMGSISYYLAADGFGTTLAWALLGAVIAGAGLLRRQPSLATLSALPLIGSTLRYIAHDLYRFPRFVPADTSLTLILGLFVAGVCAASAATLRQLTVSSKKDGDANLLAGLLLGVAILVVYLMSAEEFSGALPSIIWGVVGLITIAAGFMSRWKDARLLGLGALVLTVARVFVIDLSGLEALPRVISFAILGGLLLLVGYGYNHNKEKLQKYLEEGH
ncbi:MAG: hypothetical protein COT71_00950 [Candidatus Andersenbacteria bacterium CG10_big_fil_rev_8_21_14_0_10_54_11]|uniref:DUF2339 domain-containing protein n=1 Tax=Candidatus Andersenbacteria bacterium CG10_big_fil_rev_8_21_14_0_10_54_11 TaxID=1974485 RepID=A0A2M6X017_9BACT|nr:MAG: hypothetical protein COT71_00950 [Candidatus Andersenbacteria bacterium CG10_big_fil_rev_8_21_14_0_10_54_11]